MFSCVKKLRIELKGQGDLDKAGRICADQIKLLNTIPEGIDFYNIKLASDPNLGLGSKNGIYSTYLTARDIKIKKEKENVVVIEAQLGGSSERLCQEALQKIKSNMSNSECRDNVKSISYSFEHFTVYNDPVLTKKAVNIISSTSGKEASVSLLYGVNPFFNDDFAYFQEKVPGVYFFLGASDFVKGIISMPHASIFAVDETCIETGVHVFSKLLFEYMRRRALSIN